jgi:hypothetical protein
VAALCRIIVAVAHLDADLFGADGRGAAFGQRREGGPTGTVGIGGACSYNMVQICLVEPQRSPIYGLSFMRDSKKTKSQTSRCCRGSFVTIMLASGRLIRSRSAKCASEQGS